jgi:ribosomal protein L37AE/L43A
MTIEQRPCPRCAIRRTVRMGTWGWFCFNCRLHLAAVDVSGPGDIPTDAAGHQFTSAELLRLERYRAAIQAGVYSDWSGVVRA